MSSYVGIVTIAYGLLIAIALSVEDLRYALLPAACFSVILFLAGLLVFRRWKFAFALPWPALRSEEVQYPITIDGTSLSRQNYDQKLIIQLQVRSFAELAATVALASVSCYFLIFRSGLYFPIVSSFGIWGIEFICAVGWLVLTANLLWFTERRFLHTSFASIGSISHRNTGFFQERITFQFWDYERARRGGYGPSQKRRHDNAVLVFFKRHDPDQNAPHTAFRFHRFSFHVIPERNRNQTL
ncbi:MAG: hypothetical protein JST79_12320 [Acidobacteria bacterium]|nr:hypothetical protein [Acidobacteriota bacterium]